MPQCIYTGANEFSESFNTAEHVFPKCIGGVHTLPKGWVCDRVNNSFSKMELCFARRNPTVSITRMFIPETGRKKHKDRNHVCVFVNTTDSNDYSLGYISEGIPYSINQLCINSEIPITDGAIITIKIVIHPEKSKSLELQTRELWDKLFLFDGKACVIKDKTLPQNQVLLGFKDSKWYLGISEEIPEETAINSIYAFITKMITTHTVDEMIEKGEFCQSEHQVSAQFSIHSNLYDLMRVYAKITINCLAMLKGHEYIMNDAFDKIKNAILTGNNIEEYVSIHTGPNILKSILSKFGDKLTLGDKFHSVIFFCINDTLYSEVAIYGFDNPYIVKLGQVTNHSVTDCYICDWENKVEYTLMDCIRKICNNGKEN